MEKYVEINDKKFAEVSKTYQQVTGETESQVNYKLTTILTSRAEKAVEVELDRLAEAFNEQLQKKLDLEKERDEKFADLFGE